MNGIDVGTAEAPTMGMMVFEHLRAVLNLVLTNYPELKVSHLCHSEPAWRAKPALHQRRIHPHECSGNQANFGSLVLDGCFAPLSMAE
jgi:hypothetical protein